jgi:hypothetical protein
MSSFDPLGRVNAEGPKPIGYSSAYPSQSKSWIIWVSVASNYVGFNCYRLALPYILLQTRHYLFVNLLCALYLRRYFGDVVLSNCSVFN